MTRIVWITDPHLNLISKRSIRTFAESITNDADAVVITGDIAECNSLKEKLRIFAGALRKPVYFVLGNHDFYGGSFEQGRLEARDACGKYLKYITEYDPILINDTTALVGSDGFYDARNGIAINRDGRTTFAMHCFNEIYDFKGLHRSTTLLEVIRSVADDYADKAYEKLMSACTKRKNVIFLTHYPPFPGASWHLGKPSDIYSLPWFSSKCMGDVLVRAAIKNPNNNILVLCGHTHSSGTYRHFDNLIVKTGEADYGKIIVSAVIDTLSMDDLFK